MPDGTPRFEEIAFIGTHLYGMSLGATVTSSDYSGYNILPPASFEGMTDLLWGLHKEDMSEFWQSSEIHVGLIVQEAGASNLQPTTKVLGGNMGIRMSALTMLPPFFLLAIFTIKRRSSPEGRIRSWGWQHLGAIFSGHPNAHFS